MRSPLPGLLYVYFLIFVPPSSVFVLFFYVCPEPKTNNEKTKQARALRRRLKPYMLRRRKEDVTKDIPPKEETIIDVELTMVQKKYYRAIYERNHSVLNKVGRWAQSRGPLASLCLERLA